MNSVKAENEKSTREEGFFGVTVKNAGRDLIEAVDLDFFEFDNISPQHRNDVIAKAAANPGLLVGWQVRR